MKRAPIAVNCLPADTGTPRGSTPRLQRLREEVATRHFGPFTEIRAANQSFQSSEGASPLQWSSERFVYVRDRLSPLIRPDDWLAGALARGDDPPGGGWHPAGGDHYIAQFANNSPLEPGWVKDMASRGLFSPQGPFNHKVVDYAGFLRTGSLALAARAEALLPGRTGQARVITEGFIQGHRCLIRTAERYADAYDALAEGEAAGPKKDEYRSMARMCRKVPAHPAGSFHEAVQMLWFAYMAAADAVGRPDQYLLEYYRADTAAGRLDDARAQELIEAFLIKVHGEVFEGVYNVSSVQTLTLGGCDSEGRDACNELTRLFLQAARSVRLLRPSIYLRCADQTPGDVLDLCVAMLGEGLGEPCFFGDRPVIEGLTRLGVPLEDARDYALSGCAEIVSPGKGNWGAPNGWINMALLTLETLRRAAEGPAPAARIDDFWTLYREACEQVAEACALANSHVDRHCADFRYESTLLFPRCLETGKNVMEGGLETYFGHWEGIGLPNAADMIAAANRLAWEAGASLGELLRRVESEGDEALPGELRRLPKFGCDNPEVDEIAAKQVAILSECLEKRAPGIRRALVFGHLAGGENMHIAYGKHMPATLDGRRAGEPLADSLAGGQGRAASPTAVIQSLCRLDHSRLQAGNVSTLRMTPDDFATEEQRRNVASLIRVFVAQGGSQLQMTVADPALLRAAQRDPERHPGIMVRVAGYSSAFDGLGKAVQDEIISRYENMML